MNPLRHLWVHIRKADIPEEWRSAVESRTDEKFRADVRGGWLFELVVGTAAQHYGVERERYVLDEDIVEDVKLRIEGIAKVIARAPEDAAKIADLARAELDHRIARGYLARMAWNVLRDLRREKTRERKRQGSAADTEKVDYTKWRREERDREEPIPAAERHERLRLSFGPGAKGPAHEMLVFLWGPGRASQELVEDLATIPLTELADAWVQCFIETERREPACVEGLFRGMTEKAKKSGGQLFEFWDPLKTIDGWVEEVRTKVVGGACVPDTPLHMRVAYLYQREFGYTTGRIAAQLGLRRVDRLAGDFAPEYAERKGHEPGKEFGPFLAHANDAAGPLAYEYKPHDRVAEWQRNVARRANSAECKQLESGIGLIVSGRHKPWKAMAFLHCHCLRRTPHFVAEKYGPRPLPFMRDGLVPDFAQRWAARPDRVRAWLRTLSPQLIVTPFPTLEACSEGRDLVAALQGWSDEVLAAVGPKFAGNPGLRLFALRHRLPTD